MVHERPIILLGIRSTVKEDLQASPPELVYGQNLNLPTDIINTRFIRRWRT